MTSSKSAAVGASLSNQNIFSDVVSKVIKCQEAGQPVGKLFDVGP